MRMFLANLLLALLTALVFENFTIGGVLAGFLLSFVVLWLLRPLLGPSSYFRRLPRVVGLLAHFIWSVVVANIGMVACVLRPRAYLYPGVVAVPLEPMSDLETTMLANMVTLTPGTFSVDVSSDRSTLFVHCIDARDPDAMRHAIKHGFERRLLEAMR